MILLIIRDAALECRVDYVDSCSSYEYMKHMTQAWPWNYDKEFKEIGKTLLLGCGTTSITNVIARYVCDQFDQVDRIYVRAVQKPLGEQKEAMPGIRLVTRNSVEDFSSDTDIWLDGKYVVIPPFRQNATSFQTPLVHFY